MTHKDIYTKFMIEYDKANVTSSYPSLTEYEVATVLDKAYNALISQKVTGNNVRRSTLESDVKSIADLGPLTKSQDIPVYRSQDVAPNALKAKLPVDLLYFLLGSLQYNANVDEKHALVQRIAYNKDLFGSGYNPMDKHVLRNLPVKLVNHENAVNFMASAYNIPWVKIPVCYIEDRDIVTIYDPLNEPLFGKKSHILPEYNGETEVFGYYDGTIETPQTLYTNVVFYVDLDSRLQICTFESGDNADSVYIYDIDHESINPSEIPLDVDTEYNKIGSAIISALRSKGISNITLADATYSDDSNVNAEDIRYVVSSDPTYNMHVTYIRVPNTFVKDLPSIEDISDNATPGTITYFDYEGANMDDVEFNREGKTFKERYTFECNSTVAEELISLAVAFALENVESSRLNAKLNMRGLEA